MSSPERDPKEKLRQVLAVWRSSGNQAALYNQAVAESLGLNSTDLRCLNAIVREGSTTPGELARLTGLTSGSITTLIDRLEKEKLVERKPHPKDRRGTVLFLTQQARGKQAMAYHSTAQALDQLFGAYSDKELEFLERHYGEMKKLWTEEIEKLKPSPPKTKKAG